MTTFINNEFDPKRAGSVSAMFAALLLTVMGLAACGGGGGGNSGVSTPTLTLPSSSSGITVFAGGLGGGGNADGTPGRFANPNSLALDTKGNIFVVDTGNCNVRKVVGNIVSTLYADKTCNFGNFFQAPIGDPFRVAVSGPADSIYFVNSKGLFKIAADGTVLPDAILVQGFRGAFAFDSAGALFAVDKAENAVYQIGAGGTRTLIAGGNTVPQTGPSFADGVGAAARFFGPQGIAIDSDGIIYVADTDNHVIRKVTRQGAVMTLAGQPNKFGSADGIGSAAQFFAPSAIAVDKSGNVYVAELGNYAIRKITPAGAVTTLAGSPALPGSLDGAGAAARFADIGSIAVNEAGVLFVADVTNRAIRRVSPEGNVMTIAGAMRSTGSIDATGMAARFSSPGQLAIDATDSVYVVDTNNATIRKISPSGVVTTLAGTSGVQGALDGSGANASFSYPLGIAVDSLGSSFVSDGLGERRIRGISSSGQVSTLKTFGLIGPGDLRAVLSSIALDNARNIYFIESYTRSFYPPTSVLGKLKPSGEVATVSLCPFCFPRGVATDNLGNVYITTAAAIKRIAPEGTVVNLAGDDREGAQTGSADGIGSAARFSYSTGLAADNKGNVFVADTNNHTVRKVTAAGLVTTIAGKAGVSGVATGSLPGLLSSPQSIVVDSKGNLFVTTEDAVVKIAP
jgi:sugar lactone lactonase YvrE